MNTKEFRTTRFTFLCNTGERQMILALAERLNRSQGDTVRFILRAAAQELQLNLEPQIAHQSPKAADE